MDKAIPRDPARTLLLAWLFPGAGHWYTGRRTRALFYALTVVGVFAAGLCMGGLATVSATGHKWAFLLQLFDGPIAAVAGVASHAGEAARQAAMAAGSAVTVSPSPSRMADLGLTFTLVSAAFNVLVMADAYYLADRTEGDEA
ncbi:MAG: hypothetical protein ISS72_09475 [Candidatus Brocadiae bacterium]|nr:hypothetical protein [Candidatus Brocadiia bacterium]